MPRSNRIHSIEFSSMFHPQIICSFFSESCFMWETDQGISTKFSVFPRLPALQGQGRQCTGFEETPEVKWSNHSLIFKVQQNLFLHAKMETDLESAYLGDDRASLQSLWEPVNSNMVNENVRRGSVTSMSHSFAQRNVSGTRIICGTLRLKKTAQG